MAMLTERVGQGVAFMPFHFGGHLQGEDQTGQVSGRALIPYVLGESSNTAQTYGYDSVTQMQETKATLCKIYSQHREETGYGDEQNSFVMQSVASSAMRA